MATNLPPQLFSSLLSPQSLSPSHLQSEWIHFPLSHLNLSFRQSRNFKTFKWNYLKRIIAPKFKIKIILPTHSEKDLPSQTPDTQNVPLHSALVPHLHVPESQLSDVELSHLGLTPHLQDW